MTGACTALVGANVATTCRRSIAAFEDTSRHDGQVQSDCFLPASHHITDPPHFTSGQATLRRVDQQTFPAGGFILLGERACWACAVNV